MDNGLLVFSIGKRRNADNGCFGFVYDGFNIFRNFKVFVCVDIKILNRERPVNLKI